MFKQVHYSLSKLILDIETGEIGLPDIQRPFVWKNTKVRDLFDSMYKGFPVGYLPFWSNSMNGTRHIGKEKKQAIPRLLIVDGQQRSNSWKCIPYAFIIVYDLLFFSTYCKMVHGVIRFLPLWLPLLE